MRRITRFAIILAVLLAFTAVQSITALLPIPVSYAAGFSNYDKAIDLKLLGLLTTQPEGFDLGQSPTRAEGAVMLVRLLGKESQAKQQNNSHPFSDVPPSAQAAVGYLYHNGLIKGITTGKFGSSDPLTAREYVGFILQALGYTDGTDFTGVNVLDKAVQASLLASAESAALSKSPAFLRNDLAGITYKALSIKLKNSAQTLLDKLVLQDKVIFKPAARALHLYTSDLLPGLSPLNSYKPAVTGYGTIAKDRNGLLLVLRKAIADRTATAKIDISGYSGNVLKEFDAVFNKASDAAEELTGVTDAVSAWKYSAGSKTITVTLSFRYDKNTCNTKTQQTKQALDKARLTAASLIKPTMAEYDRELTLHDYLVNHTRYDYVNYLHGTEPDESHSAYGCLVRGTCVCEGYAEAMKLLCDLSGLECLLAEGQGKTDSGWEGHAWNIVKISGAYYHVDVTSDDPMSADGIDTLTHEYFNLTDREMGKTAIWEKSDYPACTHTEMEYYVKNGLAVANRTEFNKAVLSILKKKPATIELKVGDYSASRYKNLSDTVFSSGIVRSYTYSVNEEFGIIRIDNIKYQ